MTFDPLSKIGSAIDASGEFFTKTITELVENAEFLGIATEVFQSGAALAEELIKDYKSSYKAIQVKKTLDGLTGVFLTLTLVSEFSQWFVPDEENGKYLWQERVTTILDKTTWMVIHDIDFVNWLRDMQFIVSESDWLNFLKVVGQAMKAAVGALGIIVGIKSIDNALTKKTNFEISERSWKERENYSLNDWEKLCQEKIAGLSNKADKRERKLRNINPGITTEKLRDDKKIRKFQIKFMQWMNVEAAIKDAKTQRNDEAMLTELARTARGRAESCRVGMRNQDNKIARNIVSIILCSAAIASVAAGLGLQAAGQNGLFGLAATSIPILALGFGVNVLDLTNFIVKFHADKNKRHKITIDPNFKALIKGKNDANDIVKMINGSQYGEQLVNKKRAAISLPIVVKSRG